MRSDAVISGVVLLLVMVMADAVTGANSDLPCSERYKETTRVLTTRVHYAVSENDYNCLKEYLEAGDWPSHVAQYRYQPVHYAAARGNAEIMKLLLAYGATIHSPSDDGRSITIAACRGHEAVVKVLVEAGVDTKSSDVGGKTPADATCTCVDEGSCPKDAILSLLDQDSPKIYRNRDYPSGDGILNNGKDDLTASNKECWELCDKTQGCITWTRIKRTQPNGSKVGECWLRDYQPDPEVCLSCDSGFTDCVVDYFTYYSSPTGVLNDGKSVYTASNEECCALCKANPKCKAWARKNFTAGDNEEGKCWLRDNTSGLRGHGHYDSGSIN